MYYHVEVLLDSILWLPGNTDWLELPGALILLIVVAPSLFASTIRGDAIGEAICLIISCYLLQEHIRASGGFRNSFTKANGISNTIGIVLLFVFPVWALVLRVLWLVFFFFLNAIMHYWSLYLFVNVGCEICVYIFFFFQIGCVIVL